jgi:Tol biopolymer transport system component
MENSDQPEVRRALDGILSSRPFAQSPRMRRLLTFIVEKSLAGEVDELKESVIGLEVFDREPTYNPKTDPVVRNEARRLRSKLQEYYQDGGPVGTIRIEVPVGAYVPVFHAPDIAPAIAAPPPAAPPPPALPAPRLRRKVFLFAATGLALLTLAGSAVLMSRSGSTGRGGLKWRPFSSNPNYQEDPAFSPDGETIAFAWDGPEGKNNNLYIQRVDGDTATRLTNDASSDTNPVWSPDGRQIAFLRRLNQARWGVFSIPVSGGPERKWGEVASVIAGVGAAPHFDWSPDGKYFAMAEKPSPEELRCIVLLSATSGQRTQLTSPPKDSTGDSDPAFSPDGKSVAFRRGGSGVSVEDIYIVQVTGGQPKRFTYDKRGTEGHAWAADGRSLVVASRRDGSFPSLWRFPLSGDVPLRLSDEMFTESPAVSRKGNRIAYVRRDNDINIWRTGVDGGEPVRLIASTMMDTSPQYSPDGSHIAFRSDRSGYYEIWICDQDGRRPVRITNFRGPLTGSPRWSPDSQQIAFDTRPAGNADIYLVRADGSQLRQLTTRPSSQVVPSWSADGKSVYYASNETGSWEVWRQKVDQGAPIQMTKQGGFAAFESSDGKYVYYAKGNATRGIWRVAVNGGEETPVLDALAPAMWGNWALRPDGIYFLDATSNASLQFFDFKTQRLRLISRMQKSPSVGDTGLAVSPDGRFVLASQLDSQGSVIVLGENFR